MSIYNGFSTRSQEASYNKTVYKIAFLVQYSLDQVLCGSSVDEVKFGKHFERLYSKLVSLEKQKYHPPKFSMAFHNLSSHFCLNHVNIGNTGNYSTIQPYKENKSCPRDELSCADNLNNSVAHQTINECNNEEDDVDTIRNALRSKIDSCRVLKEIDQSYKKNKTSGRNSDSVRIRNSKDINENNHKNNHQFTVKQRDQSNSK